MIIPHDEGVYVFVYCPALGLPRDEQLPQNQLVICIT